MQINIASIKISIEDSLIDRPSSEILTPFIDTGTTPHKKEYSIKPFDGTQIELPKNAIFRLGNRFSDNGETLLIFNQHSLCRFSRSTGTFEICYNDSDTPAPARFLTELKFLLSDAAISLGGVLLHASGVTRNDVGIVFTGPSGSGKTTIARSLKGVSIINDEMMILLPTETSVTGHSTPFGSNEYNIRKPVYFPVQKLYTLKKSMRTKTDSSQTREIVMSVLSGIFMFPTTGNQVEMLMRNIDFIMTHAQCSALFFSLKDSTEILHNTVFGTLV